jgi:hypothetical protein
MRRRENFIWGFLIAVAIIMIFYLGIKTYTISKQVRAFQREEAMDITGTDRQLLEAVSTLESEMRERMYYIFNTEKDPLKLSNVVRSPKLLAALGYSESFEGEEDMRLNLTVIGANPYASIKYMGKYHTLCMGDTIGGYIVTSIDAKTVILRKENQTLTLYNRLEPSTVAEQAKLEGEAFLDNY